MNTLTGGDGPPALMRINTRPDRKSEQHPSADTYKRKSKNEPHPSADAYKRKSKNEQQPSAESLDAVLNLSQKRPWRLDPL
jgi:hypothetical protein